MKTDEQLLKSIGINSSILFISGLIVAGGLAMEKDQLKSYQIQILSHTNDSIALYDNNKLIGKCPANKIDSLILKDDQ